MRKLRDSIALIHACVRWKVQILELDSAKSNKRFVANMINRLQLYCLLLAVYCFIHQNHLSVGDCIGVHGLADVNAMYSVTTLMHTGITIL